MPHLFYKLYGTAEAVPYKYLAAAVRILEAAPLHGAISPYALMNCAYEYACGLRFVSL